MAYTPLAMPTSVSRLLLAWAMALPFVLLLALVPSQPVAAGQATPAASARSGATGADAGTPEFAAEAALARRFTPVSYLKRQAGPCDADGEPFLPAPVDVAFGAADVLLREGPDGRVLGAGVEAADLFRREAGVYLDLPGDPRNAGCDYETTFKELMGGRPPVVYARVATEPGKPGLAIQYWFFYWFNDFNNVHEADWEMIQLRFEAGSAAEALASGTEPVEVAYAQHEGGETAAWDDPKLEKEGGRPVTYPSRGSHASYYGPAVWLGWGQGGSGLGCDDTTGPSLRVEPEVVLLPPAIDDPGNPLAWTTFAGRWGERGDWFFDGPTGPNAKPRWAAPLSWQEGLRPSSVRLRASHVVGPAATEVFCDAVAAASGLLILARPYPWLVPAVLALLVLLLALWGRIAWPTLRRAWALWRRHLGAFVGIGAALVPLTLLASGLGFVLNEAPGLAARLPFDEDSPAFLALADLLPLVQGGLLLLLVGPAVVRATDDALTDRSPGAGAGFRAALAALPRTASALGLSALATFGLGLTVVGVPLALYLGVRWAFASQAAVLAGAAGVGALRASFAATRGAWWPTALTLSLLAVAGAALGPLLGIALMVVGGIPIELADGAGALVYAFTQPLAIVGATLLYRRLVPAEGARPSSATAVD